MKKSLLSLLGILFVCCTTIHAQWQRQYPLTKLENVLDIVVHDDGYGYAVGADDMILKLDPATMTWDVTGNLNTGWTFEAADYLNGTNGQYAAAGGQGLVVTDDFGLNWQEIAGAPGGIHAILMLAPDQIMVSAGNGVFLWENNAWTDLNLPIGSGLDGAFLMDRNHIWCWNEGATTVLYYTTDGGDNWDSSSATERADVFRFYNADFGVAADGRTIFHTYDGGATWEQISDNAIHNAVNDMVFGESAAIMMAATNNDPTISADTGRTWTRSDLGLISDRNYSIENISDAAFWLGNNVSSIALTEDSGATWEERCGPTRALVYDTYFTDRNNGVAVGTGGFVVRTEDGGVHWEEVTVDDSRTFFCVHGLNANDLWMGATRGVFHSTDNGQSWTEALNLIGANFNDILAVSSSRILGCTSGGIIYRSNDSGATWDTVYQTSTQMRSLAKIDDLHYYATGFNGILLKSDDAGETWNTVPAIDPLLQMEQSQFIGDEGWMITSSFENVMWHSTNAGNSWTPITLPIDRNWDGLYFITPDTGIVICRSTLEGRAYITYNGGTNWQSGYITDFPLYGVAGIPNPNGTAWIFGFGSDIEVLPYCNTLPAIADFQGSLSPCENDTITYSITAEDVEQYSWIFPQGWQIIGDPNQDTIQVKVGRNSGTVSVTGSNDCGFTSPINVNVSVNLLPVLTFISGSQNPCKGLPTTYIINATAVNTFDWSFPDIDWLITGGLINDTIEVIAGGPGNISVTGTNLCGSTVPVTLPVNPKSFPENLGIIGDETPCAMEVVEYISNTNFADTVAWNFPSDWVIIEQADLNTIAVLVGAESGIVSSVGTNECGDSEVQEISVVPIPPIDALAIYTEAESKLTAMPEGASYQWYLDDVLIPGATSQDYFPTINGDYYVVIVFSSGCTSVSDPVNVIISSVINHSLSDQIRLSPNPAQTFIELQGLHGTYEYVIYHSSGTAIQSGKTENGIIALEASAAGMCIIKIRTAAGVAVKRFIQL